MMDIIEFKDTISVMTTEVKIKNFIEKRYFDVRKLLVERYNSTFCDGINEDQINKPPQNIDPSILSEFYTFSNLRRVFILDRNLRLRKDLRGYNKTI